MDAPATIYAAAGYAAALLSAASWAISSVLLRRAGDRLSALGLNFSKCLIGSIVLGASLLFSQTNPIPAREFLFLGASGLLGIAAGDTLFFKALANLGPRLILLFGALCPVFTVIMALVFLGERPSGLAWAGILMTLAGVNWVLLQNTPREQARKELRASGIRYALVSIICNATAIILAKIGVSSVSALQGTCIRFLWALGGLSLMGLVTRRYGQWLRPLKDPQVLAFASSGILVAVFGGFYLFLLSLKYINVSVATTLNETSPLFILPVSLYLLKEKINAATVIGTLISVAGVALIVLG